MRSCDENASKKDDSDMSQDEYEVEKILGVSAVDGKLLYKVRWKGFGSNDDSWEPEANLHSAPVILLDYITNHYDEITKARKMLADKQKNEVCSLQKFFNIFVITIGLNEQRKERRVPRQYLKNLKVKGEKRIQSRVQKVAKAKLRELSAKNAKYTWLYDGAEDADSEASEQISSQKMNGLLLFKDFILILILSTDHSPVPDAGREEVISFQSETAAASNPLKADLQISNAGTEVFEEKREDLEEFKDCEGNSENDAFKITKVNFVDVVKCYDGAIKVIYTKEDEAQRYIVSVREAFEIDGYGLVQYLIGRCEFNELQISGE
ncbi:unnamed protein product [Thelazia callipaeda]|uniref:Chromo domain-containing protein n=1 Tax=Thelazia callipaeda TaxID=103827 RepID=A0A0N5DBW1_THECL|nr:unnamed protein product [Thelazia callipaeda]